MADICGIRKIAAVARVTANLHTRRRPVGRFLVLDCRRNGDSDLTRMSARAERILQPPVGESRWALRIIALAIAGIFLLTLYPFRLDLHAHPAAHSPFLLEGWGKKVTVLDAFLNVLLFVPYGFGLAALLRKKISSGATIAVSLAAGVALSYSIEFSQLFIPERESSFKDVLTNSTGALVGCIIFLLAGPPLLRFLQKVEPRVEVLSTIRNASILLACYFFGWFIVSGHLEKQTALQDWYPDSQLLLGPYAHDWSNESWKGHISLLELWDQALPDDIAARLTSSGSPLPGDDIPVAVYGFSGSAPFVDLRHNLPDLNWQRRKTQLTVSPATTWDGASWLASDGPAPRLVNAIRKSGRFSVHLRFTPSEANADVDANLVMLSDQTGALDLEIRQISSTLTFWFRDPISPVPRRLEWSVPLALEANRQSDVLFSYDGSKLWLLMDGKLIYDGYRLGPGTILAALIKHPDIQELRGYEYVFYGLVFFPSGCLLGLLWRNLQHSLLHLLAATAVGIILPSALLEAVLVHVGNQPMSPSNVCLAILMSALGWIWINLEGAVPASLSGTFQSRAR